MSRHRGYFIDQSQSLNLFMEGATMAKLTSMHFYGWKSGLKTGMYYLRTKSAVDAIKFTLENDKKAKQPEVEAVKKSKLLVTPAGEPPVPVEPLSPNELKEILSKAKESEDDDLPAKPVIVSTTVGRAVLAEILPKTIPFDYINKDLNKKAISELFDASYSLAGLKATVLLADQIMYTGLSTQLLRASQ